MSDKQTIKREAIATLKGLDVELKPGLKRRWLRYLRNGQYKQGKDTLRTDRDEYCCLGVLADVDKIGTWVLDDLFRDRFSLISPEFDDAEAPYRTALPGDYIEDDVQTALAEMNDNGFTFLEIAEVIEKYL